MTIVIGAGKSKNVSTEEHAAARHAAQIRKNHSHSSTGPRHLNRDEVFERQQKLSRQTVAKLTLKALTPKLTTTPYVVPFAVFAMNEYSSTDPKQVNGKRMESIDIALQSAAKQFADSMTRAQIAHATRAVRSELGSQIKHHRAK